MGWLKKTVDSFTGGKQAAKASREAAALQAQSADKAIASQKESRDIARSDLQPFREAGQNALGGLTSLVSDPNSQKSFIENNPFFDTLANQASSTLFANQAAKGKVGSGGTAEALQNSLFLLGNDLLNQNISQRQNLSNLGANAASGQANISQNTGSNVSNLLTQKGNAQAAGVVGARNAINKGRQGLIDMGWELFMSKQGTKKGTNGGSDSGSLGTLMACDKRLKTDIKEVGKLNNGLPVYIFKYKGSDQMHMNVMAQDVEKYNPDAVIEIDNVKYVKIEEACH